MNEADRAIVDEHLEEGTCEELYEFLTPFIANRDPYALYALSRFSLSGESDREFAERSIRQLSEASEKGVAEASYRMGVNHLYGDDVEQCYERATEFFERAVDQGHSYTKFTFGFSLYYGTDHNAKDEVRGLRLMRQAAAEGIELAIKELKRIGDADA